MLAEIVDRIAARLRRGEPLDMEREIAQNPQCADALRTLLPTLEAIATARSGDRAIMEGGAENSEQRSDVADTPAVETDRSDSPGSNPKSKIENPKSLGDFELIREVGRGGMGIVYEARQVSLGRRVAVKVLPAASLLDQRQLQRFQNEARAAAQLNHPHVVDVICVGCDGGVHYFAMRFVEGRTLVELIGERATERRSEGEKEGKREEGKVDARSRAPSLPPSISPSLCPSVSPSQKADWIAQAAEALDHAHASGVVHRDIKPSNLLIDGHGKLWITDFGVARFGDDANLTLTGDLVGTLRYMSPEQALGRLSSIGPRSDVYSLGATLYELLASRPVLAGDDRGELLRQVAFEQPVALRSLDPRLPRDLETIAHKALEKSPDDRYATAGEMAADLRRYLRGEPILAQPPTLAQRATKWCVRHLRLVAAAAMLLLLALAGLLTSTLLIARSRDDAVAAQKLAEDRDRENRRMLSIIETGLAMQAYQQGDLPRANELLDRQLTGSRIRENSGSGERDQASGIRRQEGAGGNGAPTGPHAVPRAASGPRAAEDGLPSPSRQTANVPGRPSFLEENENVALPPVQNPKSKIENPEDDFRGFAWHWLRQAIDARIPEIKSFDGHPGEVYEVDYSPDGTLLAAACDRHIIIHDANTGEVLHDIAAHDSGITSLDFSPDCALLASVSYDHRARLWHVATGELAADLGAHDCDVASIAFSPDGRRLATGDEHGLIIIWDVRNRREEKRLVEHKGKIDSLAFAADGRLVSVCSDWYMIAWNVDTAQPLWRVAAPHTPFIALAISPDSKTVASGGHLGIVFLWDLADGRPLTRLGQRNRNIQGIVFSPDNRLLAGVGDDDRAQLWDVATRTFVGETPSHGDRVWSAAFSSDGATLATGSRTRSVKLWDVESARRPRQMFTAYEDIELAFSDESTLAIASNDDVWIWPRGDSRPRKLSWPAETGFRPMKRDGNGPVHRGGPFVPRSIAWFGKDLVLQDTAGSLWLAKPDGGCRRWIEPQGQPARMYSLSPDRRWLAVLRRDAAVEIWDTEHRQLVARPSKRDYLPQFSPDSRWFYTCRDSRLLRWPLQAAEDSSGQAAIGDPEEILRLQSDLDPVAISHDGRTLLLGHVQLLDLPSLRVTPLVGQETRVVGREATINCAAFSPDGRTLATGGLDGTTSLWDVGTGQQVCAMNRREDGEIRGIVISPDGRSLAAAGRDGDGGSVTLWELK